MPGLYLAALLFSLAGLTLIDLRFKLALFADWARTAITLAVAVLGFLAWDIIGINAMVFHIGPDPNRLMLGPTLLTNLPLEEPVFLLLLSYTVLLSYLGLVRWFEKRARP